MIIHPTGTCFDDALEYIEEFFEPHLLLVHGILTDDLSGKTYSHAWVEDGDMCWDSGILDGIKVRYKMSKEIYYKLRGLIKCTKYTVAECMAENLKFGNYGPWIQEYIDLCLKRRVT